jgi:hypothetical protein
VRGSPEALSLLQRKDVPANVAGDTGLSGNERLAEVADILAMGPMRLWTRKSSQLSPHQGESLLDCSDHQSGPDDPPYWISMHGRIPAEAPSEKRESQGASGEGEAN